MEPISLNSLQISVTADPFTIESMRSYEYSVAIFVFMLFGLLVFCVILYYYFSSGKKDSSLKLGEKIMFAWILLGVLVATAFGTAQLLFGHLF